MNTLLIAESDKDIRTSLRHALENEENVVLEASKPQRVFDIVEQHHIDALFLDCILADCETKDLIKDIRKKTVIPILILNKEEDCRIRANYLDAGADDFIDIPCEPVELRARLNANLRRYQQTILPTENNLLNQDPINIRNWILDCKKMKLISDTNKLVPLTHKEFMVLEYIAKHPNKVIKREDIYKDLQTQNYQMKGRALDIKISRIRKKLGDCDSERPIIETLHGVGYIFNKD